MVLCTTGCSEVAATAQYPCWTRRGRNRFVALGQYGELEPGFEQLLDEKVEKGTDEGSLPLVFQFLACQVRQAHASSK